MTSVPLFYTLFYVHCDVFIFESQLTKSPSNNCLICHRFEQISTYFYIVPKTLPTLISCRVANFHIGASKIRKRPVIPVLLHQLLKPHPDFRLSPFLQLNYKNREHSSLFTFGEGAVWSFWWNLTPGHAQIIPPIVEETGWIIYRKPAIQLPRHRWRSWLSCPQQQRWPLKHPSYL